MDLNLYLQRVGITTITPGSFTLSLAGLQKLHRQHVLTVPFETLSAHSGEKIILDHAWIFQKIVVRRRGGFCCESNGLFLWVLRELGFQVVVYSGRVRNKVSSLYGPQFDHMILVVELEGRRWLCDVGFGEGIINPFPLEAGWEEEQSCGVFHLRVDGKEWFMERKDDGGWRSLYKFTLEERRFEDFKAMCAYHQTSPRSLLACKSLCTLQLPGGRITYIGHRLISTEYTKDGRSVKTTQDLTEDEIPGHLREKFGIVLTNKLVPRDDEMDYTCDEENEISE